MASIVGPARYMRPHKKLKTHPGTPLNQAVSDWQERQASGRRDRPVKAEAVPPPEHGRTLDPFEPEDLPGDLAWNWERAAVLLAAEQFARRVLSLHVATGAMPDSVMEFVHNAYALAEWGLMLPLTYPHLYPGDDAGREDGGWTESDAAEMGLSVRPPPRRRNRKPPPANLPGCHWRDGAGDACKSLRRQGHRYCPYHEDIIRSRLRGHGE